MKRKVLCFFSFLLILLVFCTLVSPKAEEEMLTQVEQKTGESKKNHHMVVGSISLDWENAKNTLFLIVEGEGWEDGLRISAVTSEYMDRASGHAELGAGTPYRYVYSASREPILGGEVEVVETSRGEDTYLVWNPEPFEDPYNLTNTMKIAAKEEREDGLNQSALLIHTRGSTFPFFEHNVWYRFRQSIGDDVRIYSLHDAEQFAQALPWLARLAAILLCSLLLWGGSWLLTGKRGGGKAVWIVNLVLTALILSAVPGILSQFDLPASLMPRQNILDISHYLETFQRIVTSMDALGVPTVREQLSAAGTSCALILGFGMLLTAAVLMIERLLFCGRGKAGELSSLCACDRIQTRKTDQNPGGQKDERKT